MTRLEQVPHLNNAMHRSGTNSRRRGGNSSSSSSSSYSSSSYSSYTSSSYSSDSDGCSSGRGSSSSPPDTPRSYMSMSSSLSSGSSSSSEESPEPSLRKVSYRVNNCRVTTFAAYVPGGVGANVSQMKAGIKKEASAQIAKSKRAAAQRSVRDANTGLHASIAFWAHGDEKNSRGALKRQKAYFLQPNEFPHRVEGTDFQTRALLRVHLPHHKCEHTKASAKSFLVGCCKLLKDHGFEEKLWPVASEWKKMATAWTIALAWKFNGASTYADGAGRRFLLYTLRTASMELKDEHGTFCVDSVYFTMFSVRAPVKRLPSGLIGVHMPSEVTIDKEVEVMAGAFGQIFGPQCYVVPNNALRTTTREGVDMCDVKTIRLSGFSPEAVGDDGVKNDIVTCLFESKIGFDAMVIQEPERAVDEMVVFIELKNEKDVCHAITALRGAPLPPAVNRVSVSRISVAKSFGYVAQSEAVMNAFHQCGSPSQDEDKDHQVLVQTDALAQRKHYTSWTLLKILNWQYRGGREVMVPLLSVEGDEGAILRRLAQARKLETIAEEAPLDIDDAGGAKELDEQESQMVHPPVPKFQSFDHESGESVLESASVASASVGASAGKQEPFVFFSDEEVLTRMADMRRHGARFLYFHNIMRYLATMLQDELGGPISVPPHRPREVTQRFDKGMEKWRDEMFGAAPAPVAYHVSSRHLCAAYSDLFSLFGNASRVNALELRYRIGLFAVANYSILVKEYRRVCATLKTSFDDRDAAESYQYFFYDKVPASLFHVFVAASFWKLPIKLIYPECLAEPNSMRSHICFNPIFGILSGGEPIVKMWTVADTTSEEIGPIAHIVNAAWTKECPDKPVYECNEVATNVARGSNADVEPGDLQLGYAESLAQRMLLKVVHTDHVVMIGSARLANYNHCRLDRAIAEISDLETGDLVVKQVPPKQMQTRRQGLVDEFMVYNLGLFASKSGKGIQAGRYTIEYSGEDMPAVDLKKLERSGHNPGTFAMEHSDDGSMLKEAYHIRQMLVLDPSTGTYHFPKEHAHLGAGVLANHCNTPNHSVKQFKVKTAQGVITRVFFHCSRYVEPGEEITINYGEGMRVKMWREMQTFVPESDEQRQAHSLALAAMFREVKEFLQMHGRVTTRKAMPKLVGATKDQPLLGAPAGGGGVSGGGGSAGGGGGSASGGGDGKQLYAGGAGGEDSTSVNTSYMGTAFESEVNAADAVVDETENNDVVTSSIEEPGLPIDDNALPVYELRNKVLSDVYNNLKAVTQGRIRSEVYIIGDYSMECKELAQGNMPVVAKVHYDRILRDSITAARRTPYTNNSDISKAIQRFSTLVSFLVYDPIMLARFDEARKKDSKVGSGRDVVLWMLRRANTLSQGLNDTAIGAQQQLEKALVTLLSEESDWVSSTEWSSIIADSGQWTLRKPSFPLSKTSLDVLEGWIRNFVGPWGTHHVSGIPWMLKGSPLPFKVEVVNSTLHPVMTHGSKLIGAYLMSKKPRGQRRGGAAVDSFVQAIAAGDHPEVLDDDVVKSVVQVLADINASKEAAASARKETFSAVSGKIVRRQLNGIAGKIEDYITGCVSKDGKNTKLVESLPDDVIAASIPCYFQSLMNANLWSHSVATKDRMTSNYAYGFVSVFSAYLNDLQIRNVALEAGIKVASPYENNGSFSIIDGICSDYVRIMSIPRTPQVWLPFTEEYLEAIMKHCQFGQLHSNSAIQGSVKAVLSYAISNERNLLYPTASNDKSPLTFKKLPVRDLLIEPAFLKIPLVKAKMMAVLHVVSVKTFGLNRVFVNHKTGAIYFRFSDVDDDKRMVVLSDLNKIGLQERPEINNAIEIDVGDEELEFRLKNPVFQSMDWNGNDFVPAWEWVRQRAFSVLRRFEFNTVMLYAVIHRASRERREHGAARLAQDSDHTLAPARGGVVQFSLEYPLKQIEHVQGGIAKCLTVTVKKSLPCEVSVISTSTKISPNGIQMQHQDVFVELPPGTGKGNIAVFNIVVTAAGYPLDAKPVDLAPGKPMDVLEHFDNLMSMQECVQRTRELLDSDKLSMETRRRLQEATTTGSTIYRGQWSVAFDYKSPTLTMIAPPTRMSAKGGNMTATGKNMGIDPSSVSLWFRRKTDTGFDFFTCQAIKMLEVDRSFQFRCPAGVGKNWDVHLHVGGQVASTVLSMSYETPYISKIGTSLGNVLPCNGEEIIVFGRGFGGRSDDVVVTIDGKHVVFSRLYRSGTCTYDRLSVRVPGSVEPRTLVVEVEGQASPGFVLEVSVPELNKYEFYAGDGITPSSHVFCGTNLPTKGVMPIVTVGSIRVLGSYIASEDCIVAMCDDHSPDLNGPCTVQFVATGLEYGLRPASKVTRGNGTVLVNPKGTHGYNNWKKEALKKRRCHDASKMDKRGKEMFKHLIRDVLYEFYVLRSMMRFLGHKAHKNVVAIERACRAAYREAETRLQSFGVDLCHSVLETQQERAAERQKHILQSLALARCGLSEFGIMELSQMRQRAELAAVAAAESALESGIWSKAGFDCVPLPVDSEQVPAAMDLDILIANTVRNSVPSTDSHGNSGTNPPKMPPSNNRDVPMSDERANASGTGVQDASARSVGVGSASAGSVGAGSASARGASAGSVGAGSAAFARVASAGSVGAGGASAGSASARGASAGSVGAGGASAKKRKGKEPASRATTRPRREPSETQSQAASADRQSNVTHASGGHGVSEAASASDTVASKSKNNRFTAALKKFRSAK